MKERLQKIISRAGIASRRKAEELIVDGRVKVNNEILQSSVSEVDTDNEMNPLLRNLLITIALILVIIISTLFIMKRK